MRIAKKEDKGKPVPRGLEYLKKPLTSTIETDDYVAHTKYPGWFNSLRNIGDGKNHITFSKFNDLDTVDSNSEKQFLLDWYQDENTLNRIKNLTGERVPESLKKGTFINMNSTGYVNEVDKDPYLRDSDAYFTHMDYKMNSNYMMYRKEASRNPLARVHENNHAYKDLHTDLFNKLPKKYRPSTYWINFQPIVESGEDSDFVDYLLEPTEIHSRLMEVRKHLNKKPGEIITKDELDRTIRDFRKSGDTDFIDAYDEGAFLYWLNTIASNDSKAQKDSLQYAHNSTKQLKRITT